MRFFFFIWIIILGALVGSIFLQIHLSRKKNRYLGLILPALFFLNALVMSLGTIIPQSASVWQTAQILLAPLLMLNIPTAVYLLIYLACRENRKKDAKSQLDKMNIQDLD